MALKKNPSLDKLKNIEAIEKKFDLRQNENIPAKKKVFSLYLSEQTIKELEDFLGEFGFGESKGNFVERAITREIALRKEELKQELKNKLQKLEQ